MQVKKQQLELDMEQLSDSKLEKEYYKAVYCNPAYLTSMQSAHVTCWAGWILVGIKIPWRNIKKPGNTDDTTQRAEKEEEPNSLLMKVREMKVREKSQKATLKLNTQKLKLWHSVPSLHGK